MSAITGIEAALEKFNTLQKNAKRKYTAKAAKAAMQVVKSAARENAKSIDDPETPTQDISKNIDIRAGKSKDKGLVIMRVGVLGGASRNRTSRRIAQTIRKKKGVAKAAKESGVTYLAGGDTRYWRHIELGTKNIQATPFLRPALFENQMLITSEFCDEFKSLLEGDL